MKIAFKKLRCSKCEKLVKTREQKADNTLKILCSRCTQVLRVWDGIKWLPVKPE